jgi:exonuclease SbcD
MVAREQETGGQALNQQPQIVDVTSQHTRHTDNEGTIRIILTADNHLSAYSPKLSPTKLAERRRRLRAAFKQTVDTAIARHVHLFIQAGDLFDSVDPRNLERDFVAAQLMRLHEAGIHLFAVSGNHDTPRQKTEQGGAAPQVIYHRLHRMHFFSSSDRVEPVQIEVAGLKLVVAGLSYHPGIAPGVDPLDHVEISDPDGIIARADQGIFILHTAIEGHAFPGEMETFIRRSSLAKLDGFGLIVAGHVHAYDRFSIGDKAVVVCGATERMEFGQSEDKTGFVYLELARNGLHHAEHVLIKPQPRHVVMLRTTELWPPQPAHTSPAAQDVLVDMPTVRDSAIASPMERIMQQLEPHCTGEAMVRLTLEGPLTREQYHALDMHSIWLYGQQRTFSFEIDESGLFLISDLFPDAIERGERIAPREMLENIAQEYMAHIESQETRILWEKTRQRVLDRYDELAGREAEQ